jgi:hypothetical protein
MRSRNHGGNGVDPREPKAAAQQQNQVSAEAFVVKTILPFFLVQKAARTSTTPGISSHAMTRSIPVPLSMESSTMESTMESSSEYSMEPNMESPKGSETRTTEFQFIPNIDKIDTSLPLVTTFVFDETEYVHALVAQLAQDCPMVMQTRQRFLSCLGKAFDEQASL